MILCGLNCLSTGNIPLFSKENIRESCHNNVQRANTTAIVV